MRTALIYALNDPTTGRTRYIGKTQNGLKARLYCHLAAAKQRKSLVACWVKSLLDQGLKPKIEELAVMPEGDWQAWERAWIKLYTMMGFDLLNANDGGAGCHSFRPETRAKLRAANLGKKHLLETRAKISVALKGKPKKPFSVEHCARLSAARAGKSHPILPGTRAKISAALRGNSNARGHTNGFGYRHTLEARAKISAAGRRRWVNCRLWKQLAKDNFNALSDQNC